MQKGKALPLPFHRWRDFPCGPEFSGSCSKFVTHTLRTPGLATERLSCELGLSRSYLAAAVTVLGSLRQVTPNLGSSAAVWG